MSFACINGGECTGCMRCQSETTQVRCCWCNHEIQLGEYYYDIDGDLVCEICIDACSRLRGEEH